jgi:putative ABC transport system ATP-binding protein
MIHIKDLHFEYSTGDFRLDIPAFTLNESEKVAVIGPSGSGKTTLLNLIAGILVPGSGQVSVAGTRVDDLKDSQRRNFRIRKIGFIFQDFELLDYLSVLDNILHPFRITPALKIDKEVRRHAAELAGEMGIADKLKRNAGRLSQGEKQRAAICRALLTKPALILADEATGNLDPENKEKILDLLFKSINTRGATLLAVTHDHELLPRFDRISDFKQFRTKSPA